MILDTKQLLTNLEIDNLETDFIRFFFEFCGKNLINALCKFYTDKDTLTLNLQLKFQQKFQKDEAYKILQQQLHSPSSGEDIDTNG